MRLISSREAVQFLSQAAPRPWVYRLLRCMASEDELPTYSTKGRVQSSGAVINMIMSQSEISGVLPGPELDALIRKNFDDEVAVKLVGRDLRSRYDEEPIVWTEADDPVRIDIGFFIFSNYIDWETGVLHSDIIPDQREMRDMFFPSCEELLLSEMIHPSYDVLMEGLSFELSKIEMLLPSMQLGDKAGFTAVMPEQKGRVGRPAKWDWEAAMAYVTSLAQTPDGLPTGSGAQARIEEAMRNWFLAEHDEAPAPSQIRKRAALIMRMIETPKRP